MSLTLAILAGAAAKAATPAPPPDFEWSPSYSPAPPPMVPFSRPVPAPIEITPQYVELMGAGELEVKPDLAALEAQLSSANSSQISHILRLSSDKAGALGACEPAISYREEEAAALCQAIGQNARFRFAPGFAQPLERGYIRVWVNYRYRVELRLPVRFRPRGKGVELSLRVHGDSKCSAWLVTVSDANMERLCRALAANPHSRKAKQAKLAAQGSIYPEMSLVRFWIDTLPLPPAQRIDVKVEPLADRIGERIVYPPRSPAESAMPAGAGQFALPLTQADRPEKTRRWTSVAATGVLLGIGSDGGVQSCRPVVSSGGSWLDNHACVLAATKGRFTFAAGAATAPLRHLTWMIDWAALPSISLESIK